ncbi:MAG: TrkH family potassium uptake protein [Oscillospiraceae bacterium]|nr:TrkH family potassium uptake protein [Oscillospiraceae bacterium]
MFKRFSFKLTYTQTIAFGFLMIIIVGASVLCLPISSKSGDWTPPLDALFTATSAICVTGLVLFDTYTHWSVFGQIVLILMVQTGGIGFMTLVTMFSIFRKRKIGLHERQLLVHSAGTLKLSGVVRLIKRIVKGALCIELAGTILLALRFCPRMGFKSGLYNAVFHSVSAFCSAGFDLMGRNKQFSSLSEYADDPVVNITVIMLIVTGGIGFVVWDDIARHKLTFRNYELHSKIALTTTGLLIVVGWLLFAVFESGGVLSEMEGHDKAIAALFMSVTPRTGGFSTVHTAELSESGVFLTIILMFIGGSSGSTAGGIKTTTLAVLALTSFAAARKMRHVTAFKRRIDDCIVREAGALVCVYFTVVTAAVLILCALESFSLKQILFEAASAIGTVGLSMGITPFLGNAAKVVIMLLMFIGRVGWLTLVFALAGEHYDPPVERVPEKILIG